ncbi:flagellin [Marinobacterium aestuarii]|uniref:Flagellin n=1 Tax=Marinobacterium aestuarii TaxID=1821621 RepID=A0A1A9EV00_9GAMM|nr:flagellin [Marinobacterium aestuarii]ANG61736.1 flagellin [Marinobacterium aestuarii]
MAVINTNIASLNAQRNLMKSEGDLQTSLQRLSSGLRINSAKDDAAGLAISERMGSQIRGLNQAARNANDGISLAQTAEGAMSEISNNLQRMRELAVQSRNATNSADDRVQLQKEVIQLKEEIDRVANQTSFNGTKLLDGSFTMQAFQVGANQGETINITGIADSNIAALGGWTSVATPASPITGAAPAGGGATAATSGSGVFDASTLLANFGTEEVSFDVTDGTTTTAVTLSADYSGAGGIDTLVTDLGTALGADFVVTNSGNDVTITSALTGAGTEVSVANFNADADGNTTDSAVTAFPAVTGTDGTDAVADTFDALSGSAFTLNGTNIEVGAAADAATRLTDLVSAINAETGTTGISAEVTSGALTLTSLGGTGDINVGGTDSAVVLAQTGLTVADSLATPGTTQTGFASLDISTVTGADNAILAMDGALNAINSARADLGAIQNRFSSTIANLQTSSENLSASRSRIADTDFASETASLTRAQILQQAGTSILAQANTLPQSVLSLLQ